MDADEQVIGFDLMEAADMDAMIEVVSHRVLPFDEAVASTRSGDVGHEPREE